MVISNAKYDRKHIGKKGFETELETATAADLQFEIPRYEELTFLRLDQEEE